MGEYYLLANLTKREYFDPPLAAKLHQWALNIRQAGPLMLLLSSFQEVNPVIAPVMGRWAGDQIVLIGDYHVPTGGPPYYDEVWMDYTNITPLVIRAWNAFVGGRDLIIHLEEDQ